MPNYSAQVTIFPESNIAADAMVNTFSFSAVDDTDLPDIATALETRYQALTGVFNEQVRETGHLIKMYDRADPVPRAPRFEDTFNLSSNPVGSPAPPELALCVSFQASPFSGIPQARRRGRVYLGFFDVAVIGTTGRPSSTLNTAAVAFGQGLLDASQAAPDWEWVVWSTTNGAPYIITNGWVDDEFDIQRRRGRLPTGRSLFS